MSVDLSPIVQPILAAIGLAITAMIPIYVPRMIAAFEARTGIQLTEQQRATVLGAVKTAAGVLETKLDQGAIKVEHINAGNPAVQAEAQATIVAIPNAAAALGMTVDSLSRLIVGATNTAAHGATTTVTTAPAPNVIVAETTQGATPT